MTSGERKMMKSRLVQSVLPFLVNVLLPTTTIHVVMMSSVATTFEGLGFVS